MPKYCTEQFPFSPKAHTRAMLDAPRNIPRHAWYVCTPNLPMLLPLQLMEKDSYMRFLQWDAVVELRAAHEQADWLCL